MAEIIDPKTRTTCGQDLLSDCRVMLRFALKEGVELPEELLRDVACLDRALKNLKVQPISCLPLELIGEFPPPAVELQAIAGRDAEGKPAEDKPAEDKPAEDKPAEDKPAVTPAVVVDHRTLPKPEIQPAELALKVYMGLSKAVAPATALTLQLSEPPTGKRQFLGGMPPLVKAAAYAAVGCVIGFVLTAVPIVSNKLWDEKQDSGGRAAAAEKTATETDTAYKKAAADVDAAAVELTKNKDNVKKAEADDKTAPVNRKPFTEKELALAKEADKKAAEAWAAAQGALDVLRAKAKTAIEDRTKTKTDLKTATGEQTSNVHWFWLWLWRWLLLLKPWAATLNCFFGAGFGAAFFVLLNTKDHLVNRSYDPKYNAVYVARFITGLVGGVILATTLGPSLKTAAEEHSGVSFTPGLLAILGGFAADAVQQILQRMVDILLTAVRGDGAAKANAETASKLLGYERETDPTKKKTLLDELFSTLKKTGG